MASPFSRSLQFLEADRFGPGFLLLACLSLVLLLWGLWFFLVDVSVYIVSDRARLEVARSTYPLQAPINGRVVAVHGALGEHVAPGDPILDLDAREPRLALDEEQASRAGLATQIQSLRREVADQQRALDQFQRASRSALAQQQQLYEETAAAARLARDEAERLARLHEEAVVSEMEAARAESLARQSEATARSQLHALERLRLEQQSQGSDREAELDRDIGELRKLEGESTAQGALVESIRHRIGRHRITAPAAGHIGEIENLKVGMVVKEGQLLGLIIPEGDLKIVALFPPGRALGRIRPGQPARVTLRGFPWVQYGSLSAVVSQVAGELRNGLLRVELAIRRHPSLPVALQHGLPGTAEVEVERVSPATLVLRQAGRLLTRE